MPGWALGLDRLDMINNNFEYETNAQLLVECYSGGVECTGTPPASCRAFGSTWEVEASSGKDCVQCDLPSPWPLVILVSMLGLFTLFAISYALLMIMRPHLLKYFFSTVGIFVAHLQTLTIVGNLKLAWPPSTKKALSLLVVNGLQLEAARPECVAAQLKGEDEGDLEIPLFYLMSAAKVALPLVVLLLLFFVRRALTFAFRHRLRESDYTDATGGRGTSSRGSVATRGSTASRRSTSSARASVISKGEASCRSGRASRASTEKISAGRLAARLDRLELIETIIFSLILVTSWKSIFDLIDARDAGSDKTTKSLALAGCILASVLLVVQVRGALLMIADYC